MNKSLWTLRFLFGFMLLVLSQVSCVDKEFDEPPSLGSTDPEITKSIVSVADILAKWVPDDFVELTEDVAMEAIVIADDASGNFYKTLVVSDENGAAGIQILIDQVEMFNTYSIGRRVFVNTQGLFIGDYNGTPQLGTTPTQNGNFFDLGRIPDALVSATILPGARGVTVTPKTKTISGLGNVDLNTLISLSNVEFGSQALNSSYADPIGPTTINQTIQDCSGNTIVLRNSGYADFAATTVPSGNGTLSAIFTRFGNTDQLFIRNTDDVVFEGARCNGSTGGGDQISVKSLRDAFQSGTTVAPDGFVIGIAISDRSTGNFNGQNVFIQDGEYGIVVRFTAQHSINLGDEVKINVSGLELSLFRGLLQLNNAAPAGAQILGASTLPVAKEVTVSEFLANGFDLQSTRVLIKSATIGGDNNYGENTVTDATGMTAMYTSFLASFNTQNVPSGSVDITAIASIFDDAQLLINGPQDVSGGTTGTGGGDCDNTEGEMSIENLKCKYADGDANIGNNFLKGIIISDVVSGNINGRNMHVQSGGFGIVLRVDEAHNFTLGQEIQVNLNGRQLSEFNGLLQITDIPNSDVTVLGNGTLPEPRIATISEILANAEAWESTLVRVEGVSLSGGSTFAGTLTVADATGSIPVYTRNDASISNIPVPGGAIDLVGIVGQFTDYQLLLRNADDIQ